MSVQINGSGAITGATSIATPAVTGSTGSFTGAVTAASTVGGVITGTSVSVSGAVTAASVTATSSITNATWTTGTRPTPVTGLQGFNTSTQSLDLYNGSSWDVATMLSDFTGANQSLTGAGYQVFPGGLIIQWTGAAANAGGTTAVTWPIAFTTIFKAMASAQNTTAAYATYTAATTTGTNIDGWSSAGTRVALSVGLIAIGK